MSETPATTPGQHRKFNWLRVLFRLFLLLLIGIILGTGLYYGGAYLAGHYIQAVQSNTENLDLLNSQVNQMNEQLTARLDDLASRLDSLELQNDDQKQTFANMEVTVTAMEAIIPAMETRIAPLETQAADSANTLSSLQTDLAVIQTRTSGMEKDNTDIQTSLTALETQVGTLNEFLGEIDRSAAQHSTAIRQIKVLVLLSRAQLYIDQNNYGLAAQDIQTAHEVVAWLENESDPETAAAYTAMLVRLDSALTNLPAAPVTAAADLESAWNNLITMVQTEPQTQNTPSPTPES